MSKKIKVIITVLLVAGVLISVFRGSAEKGTIKEFVDDAVIVEFDSGTKVVRIENYLTYIPTGEQWSVGDKVEIRNGLFNKLSMRLLTE